MIKKISLYMIQAEWDLSDYVTKSDLKNQQAWIYHNLLKKIASLKSDVDKLDIDELEKSINFFKQFEK